MWEAWQPKKIMAEYFWGRGGTKRFVDNKITSNPNWPTFRSPDPINLTLVNSVLQSKHLKFTLGWVLPENSPASGLCMTTSAPRTPVLEPILQVLTGRFSSRSSKYVSLSNSHNMLIAVGHHVDLFKALTADMHILWTVLRLCVQTHHAYSEVNAQCPSFPH